MIKRILTLILFLIPLQTFASIGDNTDFWIISQNDYVNRISKGKDVILRRYIVVPNIDKKFKNIFEIKDEKAILAKFSFMLKRNKNGWIEKYITAVQDKLNL